MGSLEAGEVGSGEHLCVWYLVLPLYVKQFSQAGGVEVIQLLDMELGHSPCLAAVEKGGALHFSTAALHYRFVHTDLCLCDDSSAIPHTFAKCAEGTTCFVVSGVDLIIVERPKSLQV